MPPLNFEEPQGRQFRMVKQFRLLLGVSTLVIALLIGSTLASNINLNSGAPMEFGQGVSQFTACDDQVNVTPVSTYSNGLGGGFRFTAVTLSDLDGTTQEDSSDKGCAGKTFAIKSYDANGELLTPSYAISLNSAGNFSSTDGNPVGTNIGETDSSVKLIFSLPSINAESVHRITIESASFTNKAFLTTTAIETTSQLISDSFESSLPYQVSSTPVARLFIYPGSETIIATVTGPGTLGTSDVNGGNRVLFITRDPNSATNLYFFPDGTYGRSTILIRAAGQLTVKTLNFGSPENGNG